MLGGATIGTFSFFGFMNPCPCVPLNNNARLAYLHANNLHE